MADVNTEGKVTESKNNFSVDEKTAEGMKNYLSSTDEKKEKLKKGGMKAFYILDAIGTTAQNFSDIMRGGKGDKASALSKVVGAKVDENATDANKYAKAEADASAQKRIDQIDAQIKDLQNRKLELEKQRDAIQTAQGATEYAQIMSEMLNSVKGVKSYNSSSQEGKNSNLGVGGSLSANTSGAVKALAGGASVDIHADYSRASNSSESTGNNIDLLANELKPLAEKMATASKDEFLKQKEKIIARLNALIDSIETRIGELEADKDRINAELGNTVADEKQQAQTQTQTQAKKQEPKTQSEGVKNE